MVINAIVDGIVFVLKKVIRSETNINVPEFEFDKHNIMMATMLGMNRNDFNFYQLKEKKGRPFVRINDNLIFGLEIGRIWKTRK